MTVVCPQCATVSPTDDGEIGPAGKMIRCEACGTRWLARVFADDPYRRTALQPLGAAADVSDAIVIEHVAPAFTRLAPDHDEAPVAPSLPRDQRLIKILASIFGGLVAVVIFHAQIVAALPAFGRLPAEVSLLEFQSVRSETVHLKGMSTLFVEGEIVNRSAGDVALPAIRITLRSPDGDPVTSWLVEPAVAGLAPGRSIGFRSALASPPPDATQVTLNLAAREGT